MTNNELLSQYKSIYEDKEIQENDTKEIFHVTLIGVDENETVMCFLYNKESEKPIRLPIHFLQKYYTVL
jgi:hypothetical protein